MSRVCLSRVCLSRVGYGTLRLVITLVTNFLMIFLEVEKHNEETRQRFEKLLKNQVNFGDQVNFMGI